MTIRVLIADDSSRQREGWRMILDSQPDISVVGEAGDGARALAIVRRTPTDVIVMNIRMPRVNGLVAATRIVADDEVRALGQVPRVVLVTAFDLDEHVPEAARAGAFAVVFTDIEPEALLEIVRAAGAADAA